MESPAIDSLTRDLILAQDGDYDAFTRVVHSASPEIHRFCSWFSGPGSDIDDLVQETLIRVFRKLDTFRVDARGISWIITIARRVCIDDSRKNARQQKLRNQLRLQTMSISTSEFSSTLYLMDIIDTLPEDLREAFVLVKIFGFSYAEIAEVACCPIGTIQSRVARARFLLAKTLDDDYSQQSA